MIEDLRDAMLNGNAKAARALTEAALHACEDPLALIDACMVPAMDEVGRRFEAEEYFVPELLLPARAMKAALELLRPLLADRGARPAGRAVGTVMGDLHDIGKNLVASMLEGGGFEVTDSGSDVAPEQFVGAVVATGARIAALSALLTVPMPAMENTIEALRHAGIRNSAVALARRAAADA